MPDMTIHRDLTRTIPTPDVDLTPFQARQLAARRARDDEKRARLARIWDLEKAAEESQRATPRPAPKVKRTPAPGNPMSRPQPLIFRVCAGTCGRMTRANSVKADRAPGTIPRIRDGKCRPCLRTAAIEAGAA